MSMNRTLVKVESNLTTLPSGASAHIFIYSFARHLKQANYDICTIKELIGHSDLRATTIFTRIAQSLTIKQAKCPLIFYFGIKSLTVRFLADGGYTFEILPNCG